MKHEIKKEIFTIKDIKEDFEFWIEKDYISKSLKEELQGVDILILPYENFRENKNLFPQGMADLYKILKAELPSDYKIDICIETSDYLEIALYNNTFKLGKYLVTTLVAPVLINLLSSHIFSKIASPDDTIQLELKIVNEKTKVTKQLNYEGTAKDFNKIEETVKDLFKDNEKMAGERE